MATFGNKDAITNHLREYRREFEVRFREQYWGIPASAEHALRIRSNLFRIMLLDLDLKARLAAEEILLFEHGPNYVKAIDVYGADIEPYILEREMDFVFRPHLVIFLSTPPEEIQKRPGGATRLTREVDHLRRVCAGLEEMYEQFNGRQAWIRRETSGKKTEELADSCMAEIKIAYEKHLHPARAAGTNMDSPYYIFD